MTTASDLIKFLEQVPPDTELEISTTTIEKGKVLQYFIRLDLDQCTIMDYRDVHISRSADAGMVFVQLATYPSVQELKRVG